MKRIEGFLSKVKPVIPGEDPAVPCARRTGPMLALRDGAGRTRKKGGRTWKRWTRCRGSSTSARVPGMQHLCSSVYAVAILSQRKRRPNSALQVRS